MRIFNSKRLDDVDMANSVCTPDHGRDGTVGRSGIFGRPGAGRVDVANSRHKVSDIITYE